MPAFVYRLRCRDGRSYVGSARDGLERRLAEHNAGIHDGFTKSHAKAALVLWQAQDEGSF